MSEFYEQNSQQYFDATVTLDPSTYLNPLLALLPAGAKILDVGCGSGRDMKWLHDKGYEVCGVERSAGLGCLARQHSGCSVIEADFETYDFSVDRSFDAVLLIGALVHYEREKVGPLLENIFKALKPAGFVLISMKEGDGLKTGRDKRRFACYRQAVLAEIFCSRQLKTLDFMRTQSVYNSEDVWLTYILQSGLK